MVPNDRIQIESFPGGDRFVLPYRRVAFARLAGWGLIGFGAFVTLFMVGWMWMPVSEGIEMLGKGEKFGIFLLLFGATGLIGLAVSLAMIVAGIAFLQNKTRTIVEIVDGRIICREKFGWASFKRKCKLQRILQFRIADGGSVETGPHNRRFEKLGQVLVAEGDGNSFPILFGYPKELLNEVATELSHQLKLDRTPASTFQAASDLRSSDEAGVSSAIPVVHGTESQLPVERPASSTAEFEQHEQGVQFDFPRMGVLRAPLFWFGLFWNVFITFFLVVMIGTLIGGEDVPILAFLFLIPFVAVGVGLQLSAINSGRRRTALVTANDRLLVITNSIFGQKKKQFAKSDIESIVRGPSGVEINERPVLELQIHTKDGTKHGFLTERNDDELAWVAHELNQALSLSSSADGRMKTEAEIPRLPSGQISDSQYKKLQVDRGVSTTTITMPRPSVWSMLLPIGIGFTFFAIACGVAFLMYSKGDMKDFGGIIFFTIWGTLFGGGGLAIGIGSLIGATQRWVVEIASDRLRIDRVNILGTKSWELPRNEIEEVEVADSGMKVGSKTLMQLRIQASKDSVTAMRSAPTNDLNLVRAEILDKFDMWPTESTETKSLASV